MDLSFRARLALNHCLERPTWFSSQPTDVNHWYDFFWAYALDHGATIDTDEFQAYLQRRLGIADESPLMLAVRQRVLLARHILAFLERAATHAPNDQPSSDGTDHNLAVWSQLAEASRLPSGENASATTAAP